MKPGRFLFVTWGGGGNVPPLLGLAGRLMDRGHSIRVLASSELRDRVEASGCEFRSFRRVPRADEGAVEDDPARFFAALVGEAGARDLLAEIERDAPDVLLVDCMQLNCLAAAQLSGITTAAFVHFPYERWRMHPVLGEMVRAAFDETRVALGLPRLTDELVRAQTWDRCAAAIVVTPQEFDFPTNELPANVRYVGPIFEPAASSATPLEWPPGRADDPLVLVSFSSTYMHQEYVLRRVAEAVKSVDARCLVTLGEALDESAVALPSGVLARRWVPHSAVLPDTSLVVTHAGHSTVMAALAHGVPLVCMPMGRDQFGNAKRVEDLEAGITISMNGEVSEIHDAVLGVLKDARYREGAARMAEVIRGYENGARAVAELEGLIS